MAAEREAMIQPLQALKDITDSEQRSEDEFASSELSSNDLVPVDPELTKSFSCLQLIDEFRWTKDAALIDELLVAWQDSSDASDSSASDLREARGSEFILNNIIPSSVQ
jgi:hypothetical protein